MPNTPDPLAHALRQLAFGRALTRQETTDAFAVLMRGEAPPAQVAALLMGLRVKGETASELAGAADALRAAMVPLPFPSEYTSARSTRLVDTCGTGGGSVGTFNISTAAAFVAAAAGVGVAKHGNRSFTSRSGSADVLEALGVDIALAPQHAADALARHGFVFLFAPVYHPAMRHVGPARKELGVPTVMNLLGPMANPAGVHGQVVGVADRDRAPLVAGAFAELGGIHTLVVHAEVGMDEISPHGVTHIWEVKDGAVATWLVDPAEFGVRDGRLELLKGGEPAENARRIERLLGGGSGVEEDPEGASAVILNAGAAIYVGGQAATYREGVDLARDVLRAGDALRLLERIRLK
ncbi:MAG: anthranilate phosphoribosyltransferase [Gemmatimonadota bacterium]